MTTKKARWVLLLGCLLAATAGCNVGDGPTTTSGDGDGDGDGDADAGNTTVPSFGVRDGTTVFSDLTVPLIATDVIGADTLAWTQKSGEAATISDADQATAYAQLPLDLPAGATVVFTVTATNAAGSQSADVTYTIADPVFDDFLAAIVDPAELGTSEGIDFNDDGLWVISVNGGFVSRFDSAGAFVERFEIPGTPVGANFDRDGNLLVARNDLGTVEAMNPADGVLTPIVTGAATTNYPLPDKDGNIFVSNRQTQQTFRYDAALETSVIFTDVNATGVNPNAIAFGPEPDVLYVGATDVVYRVPINADGTAGTPTVYVTVTGEVDGLAFDLGRNLWIGTPGPRALYVAPYVETGETTVRTTYAMPAGPNRFVSLTFGEGAFGENTLYWTSLGDRTVGRLDIGLPTLPIPLAPVTP